MRPRQRKKKRPVREEVPEVREIPDLIESKIVPGLFYNLFSRTLLYEDKIEESPPLVFQLLLFLEFNRGEAKKENILENCWKNPPADATFRSQISEANKVLMELNVTANISSSSGVVKWE